MSQALPTTLGYRALRNGDKIVGWVDAKGRVLGVRLSDRTPTAKPICVYAWVNPHTLKRGRAFYTFEEAHKAALAEACRFNVEHRARSRS